MTSYKAGMSLFAICAMATSLVAAPVVSADPRAAVDSALANHNIHAAGVALDALVEARLPAKGLGRPDPVLDRLFVDFFSASGASPVAATILQRVLADATAPNHQHYRLLLAAYKEAIGEFTDAEQQYRGLIANSDAGAEDQLSARLGLARLQLMVDPAATLAALDGIDTRAVPQANAWEVDLLRARAASMMTPTDPAKATASLNRAWDEAPNASLVDAATSRVAGDWAILVGRSGDRKTLVTMLAVDRYNRNGNDGQYQVAADLPLCGTAGITPQDRVVISVAHLPAPGRPAISLVWTNRVGIAGPFLEAAERSGALSVGDGQSATFELACRTSPSIDYAVRITADTGAAAWMTSQGAYPLFKDDDNLSPAAAASLLAQREARYGPTSVMLLPILLNILPTAMADMSSDDTSRKQAVDTFARVGAILVANHAPADLTLFWQMSSIGVAVLAQTKTPTEGQTEFEALLAKAATDPNISLDTLYLLASGSAQTPNLPNSFKASILASTLDLLQRKAPVADQRTAALALRLHSLRKSQGDDAGAAAAVKPLGLSSDLCILSDPAPHFVSSDIKSDDYPGDLVFTSMRGLIRVEFNLDGAGNAKDGRIILSDPPYAFDAITLSRVSTIRYEPARMGGRAVACRAVDQTVRWQLPD